MSWFGPSLSVSSGGHVYDRTTGTWEGATQGSVGDGIDRSVADRAGIVIHDANGAVGFRFNNGGTPAYSGGGGGSGPASAQVTNGVTGATSAGGLGAGSAGVSTGGARPGGAGAGSYMVGVGGPLKPKMKPTGTQLLYGGKPVMPHPGFSDMDEVEARLGDGDSPLDPAWYYKWSTWAADTYHNNVTLVPPQTQFQPGEGQWLSQQIGEWWDQTLTGEKPVFRTPGFSSGGF